MNILVSIAVLALQRVPIVNQLPAVRDAGTVQSAIKGLNKAVAKLEDVAGNQRRAAANKKAAIAQLEQGVKAAEDAAKQAERIGGKIADLLS